MSEIELLEKINNNLEIIGAFVVCLFLWLVLRAFYKFIEKCIF